MSSQEWWDNETEVEAEAGLPAKRQPKEFTEVEQYKLPSVITAKWIKAQLTKDEWVEVDSTQGSNKLNPFLIESMCRDAKKGLSKRSIMARAGYAATTWNLWERKAAEGELIYALWYRCMMVAVSSKEEKLLEKIEMAGDDDWKAAKWLLETLNRDEYGPTPKSQTVNIAGDVHSESTSSVNYLSQEESVDVLKLLQGFGVKNLARPEIDNVVEGEVVEDDN